MQSRDAPWATLALVALNVAVFGVMITSGVPLFSPGAEQALHWGADFGPATLTGEWWRVGTSLFLHFGLLHLAVNMWVLLNLGPLAEALYGRAAFVALYAVSGVGGNLASLAVHPIVVSGGASGAIFGVAGGLVVALLRHEHDSELRAGLRKGLPGLVVFVAWNLLGGLAKEGIDNVAHLGGLVTGAAFGMSVRLAGATGRRPIWSGAIVALFAIALTAAATATKKVRGPAIAAFLAQGDGSLFPPIAPTTPLDVSDPAGEVQRLERLVAERPDSTPAAVDLANAYLRAGRFQEAILILQRARGRRPDDGGVLTALGTAFLAVPDFDRAVEAYEAAFARDSVTPDTRYNLAAVYLERGRARGDSGARERARADLDRALRLHADTALDRSAREGLSALAGRAKASAGRK